MKTTRYIRIVAAISLVVSVVGCGPDPDETEADIDLDEAVQGETFDAVKPLPVTFAASDIPPHKPDVNVGIVYRPIPDHYLVAMNDGHDPEEFARRHGAIPDYVSRSAVVGFAATLTKAQVERLRQDAAVKYIEQDQEGGIEATQSLPFGQPWGLDRIDQRSPLLSWSYIYYTTASNVQAYIIDTGIQVNHPEFGGRAGNSVDLTGAIGPAANIDCNGHGTAVAGIVGSATYGVAKGVMLRSVRVSGCDGTVTAAKLVEGMNWVRNNAVKPAVVNISIGVPKLKWVNDTAQQLADSGIFVAVSAGNDGRDACTVSPASAPNVFTAAASNYLDGHGEWFDAEKSAWESSNHGPCVDGYAPGVEIMTTCNGGQTCMASGTSMAAPYVTGLAAMYKATLGDRSSSTIANFINNGATTSVIANEPVGTPDRLIYSPF
ncbi:S8 family serine peptidase [Sorangium sp. So ce385]|uniref:S8 family peptidase n=1 Tax=Sorangium sp. So ce385 TaxID=3133308 RepID=UPI003F5C76DD